MYPPVRAGVPQLSPIWETKARAPLAEELREANELGVESPVPQDGSRDADTTTQEGDQVVITACGRTLGVELRRLCTLADIRAELQNAFHMDGHAFSIFDSSGAPLTTDAQVHQAVDRGLTPLGATLPDDPFPTSEEPQMQWRLMHDQVQSVTDKIASLERQVCSLRQEMEACMQRQRKLTDGLQPTACPLPSTCERQVAAEVSEQMPTVSEQINWLRDAFEQLTAEKSAHGQEINVQMAAIEEVRAELDLEKRTREALEGQCAACTRALEEQLHAASAYHGDMLREHVEAFKTVTHEGLQQLTQEVLQVRSNSEAAASLASARLADMEERYASLECRVLEARPDTTALERGREPEGIQPGVSLCVPVFNESRDQQAALQERWLRDSQQRLARQAWVADQTRQITDLEKKLNDRMDREVEGARSWAVPPIVAAAASAACAAGTPRAGHNATSPLRSRPQVSSLDMSSAATTVAGGSPLRPRPAVTATETSSGASPLRLRPAVTPLDASSGGSPVRVRSMAASVEAVPTVGAQGPSGSSPLRARFPLGSGLVSNPAATGCMASTLATPRGSPGTPVAAVPRGRAVAPTTGIACSSPPGASEARKQSFSPVRQMLLITQPPFSAGIGTNTGTFTRS